MRTKSPTIIQASKSLQMKAGIGEIDPLLVQQAEDAIKNNKESFLPFAQDCLSRFAEAIDQARKGSDTQQRLIAEIVQPIMDLKGNAQMFHFNLVSSLANTMLAFFESIERLDEHVLEIADAHHKTLTTIFLYNIHGDGGPTGKKFQSELSAACARYFAQKG